MIRTLSVHDMFHFVKGCPPNAVVTRDVSSFEEMVAKAKRFALRQGMAKAGGRVVIMAGVPFGRPGSTNMLHVQRLTGKELEEIKR